MKPQAFKYRVVGAIFIVSLAVIVIPALLNQTPSTSPPMTEVVSHPLVFSNAPTPLETSEYAFSDLVSTLKEEEIAANREKADQPAEIEVATTEVATTATAAVAPTAPTENASAQAYAEKLIETVTIAETSSPSPQKVAELAVPAADKKTVLAETSSTKSTATKTSPAATPTAKAKPPAAPVVLKPLAAGHTPTAGGESIATAVATTQQNQMAIKQANGISAKPLAPSASVSSDSVATPIIQFSASASQNKQTWTLQMGAFKSEANANALVARLQQAGYSAYVYTRNSNDLFRVIVGVEGDKKTAEQRLAELNTKLDIKGVIIRL